MSKWIAVVAVVAAALALAGGQGVFWYQALHSQDLAFVMSFVCGMLVGLVGYLASKAVWMVCRDREHEKRVLRLRRLDG